MRFNRYIPLALAVGVAGAAAVPPPAAAEGKDGDKVEYTAPQAKKAALNKQVGLASDSGLEANVIRFEVEPGFEFSRHYHTGDVFVYVESGALAVETANGREVIQAGEAYYETPNLEMTAANPSASEKAVLVVFQVGGKGEPIMVRAD